MLFKLIMLNSALLMTVKNLEMKTGRLSRGFSARYLIFLEMNDPLTVSVVY